MRKFSKILALVLAFAMVLCPVLTAAAEGEAEVLYSSAILNADIADGKADVTLTVETIEEINAIDFKINLAKGVSFDPEVDTVSINADESGDAASWSVVTNYADGVLSVLAVDGDDMANVAAYLVFNITLTVENASDYDFYLTKIYAVGAGSADADEVIAVFPYADNAQSGVIDVEAARTDCPDYFVTNVCAHANVTTTETPATCTEPGSSIVTCNDCGSVISETELPATGHTFAEEGEIIAATEEAVGYYGYDIACSVCGALNPAYYAEDGSVRTDVDFASLAADGVIDEIPMLEVPCAPADVWSSDETGHWHDCTCGDKHDFAEHIAGDAVEVERVDALPGVAGYYVTVVSCTECEYEISRTTTEIPALPVGPVLDETIKPSTHTVAIGETFGIGFRFDLSTLSEDYASYRIDLHRTTFATGFNFAYEDASYTTFSKNTKQGFMACTTTYYGIQLFSLTAPIEYTLHCFDANGDEVAYSETFTTTLADVAVAYHDLSTTSAPIKKVMADLIQVGAAALNHFTKNRTQNCDYSTLPVPTIDSPYITTELGALASHSSSEGTAITITGALQQSPYFNMRFSGNIANKDQYEFKVSFYQALSKKEVTYIVGPDAFKGNATTISTSLTTFPIFATNADVTFTLYQNGEVIGTSHYCLEKYIADTMATTTSATLKTLLQEVGEMAQSIRTARNI